MANMKAIHERLGNTVCRRCIRKAYQVDLEPSDCYYAMYPSACSACGEVHNIVVDLRRSGKLKLLFK